MAAKDTKTQPAADAEKKKTPRERFATTGVNRVNNVIHALEILENVADRNTYEYTKDEVTKLQASIQKAMDSVNKRFADALAGVTHKPVKEGFSL